MKITRLGHAAVLIEASKTILIDPFLTDNPLASVTPEELPHIDFILVTHDHFDHWGDTIAIAKRDKSTLIGVHELSVRPDVQEAKINAVGANIGGTYTQDGVSFTLTQAIHSSENGSPSGFVVKVDGKTIYHSGDTALFSDMSLIPELYGKLDLAFLPIGGHYTMDEQAASKAAKLLKPDSVVPIHYNTWPPISADTDMFVSLSVPINVRIVDPGDSFDLS
jgi:L-ascorbate metabolism protein UlaG (beta-lactamase superfamily)